MVTTIKTKHKLGSINMTNEELKALLMDEVNNAIGYLESDSADRAEQSLLDGDLK